ncbi:MAG TPA: glutathione peroxidase [Poseidonia sp.]|nr:glutathione peroxidase [Poseidonia sp.]
MSKILDIKIATMEGTQTTLRELGGTRWLVVNVASACGATPQYNGLQEIHAANENLTVIGFPCNQFGAQEPGKHAEICEFAAEKYNVDFPLMAKIDVKGEGKTGLYSILSEVADADGYSGDIRWNFEKFLIESDGSIQRFSTRVTPENITL